MRFWASAGRSVSRSYPLNCVVVSSMLRNPTRQSDAKLTANRPRNGSFKTNDRSPLSMSVVLPDFFCALICTFPCHSSSKIHQRPPP